jgi:hypothetical protein
MLVRAQLQLFITVRLKFWFTDNSPQTIHHSSYSPQDSSPQVEMTEMTIHLKKSPQKRWGIKYKSLNYGELFVVNLLWGELLSFLR